MDVQLASIGVDEVTKCILVPTSGRLYEIQRHVYSGSVMRR
jgi:hypothetical protein